MAILAIDTEYTRANSRGFAHESLLTEVAPEALCRPLPEGTDAATFHTRAYTPTGLIRDGHRIELGGRTLEVLHVPGHTPDAVAVLDSSNGLLFTGDSFYHGPIWLFVPETDFDAYQQSVNRLAALAPHLRRVLGAHNVPTAAPAQLLALRDAVAAIRSGAAQPAARADQIEFRFDGVSILTRGAGAPRGPGRARSARRRSGHPVDQVAPPAGGSRPPRTPLLPRDPRWPAILTNPPLPTRRA